MSTMRGVFACFQHKIAENTDGDWSKETYKEACKAPDTYFVEYACPCCMESALQSLESFSKEVPWQPHSGILYVGRTA